MSSISAADEASVEVKAVEGIVKWFDPVKGYGFLVQSAAVLMCLCITPFCGAAAMILFTPAHG